jgi:hypothetical protein
MLRKYAGIGSRKTPGNIITIMQLLGEKLSDDGWLLRSGHATGADQAFEGHARHAEIFLPWGDYNIDAPFMPKDPMNGPTAMAMEIAAEFHPAWDKCSPGAKLLHARNSHIVLGPECNDPVEMVVAWFDPFKASGTQQAIRIAHAMQIPVKNLYYGETAAKACQYLEVPVHELVY